MKLAVPLRIVLSDGRMLVCSGNGSSITTARLSGGRSVQTTRKSASLVVDTAA